MLRVLQHGVPAHGGLILPALSTIEVDAGSCDAIIVWMDFVLDEQVPGQALSDRTL